jgi:acyl-CoA synthetase (NDP forming)
MTALKQDADQASPRGIEAFFAPRSVAVVGPSPGKLGYPNLVLRNLAAHGFTGAVYAVNPRYREVDGVACYPSLADMPETPDLCVIAVRADLVPGLLRDCVARGVAAVSVIASGFAEQATADGVALQEELRDIIAGTGTRMLGPNCLGIASFAQNAVSIASANIPSELPVGPVAILSQSGGVSLALMLRGAAQGLGLAHLVSVGNELDVSVPELLEVMARREDVSVVLCYLEGVRNPTALRRAIESCTRAGKPVIVLRGGLTASGKAAAASHTGALAGDGAVFRGFIAQIGAIEAQSIDHAIGMARLFATFGRAPGRNVGGFAGGGGLTVLFTDMLARAGVQLPVFADSTRERIRAALPDVTPYNPMDMGGLFLSGDGASLSEALTAMAQDPSVDVLAMCVPPYLEYRDRVINGAIVKATESLDKPVIIISYAVPGAPSVLKEAGRFIMEPPEAGVASLCSWLAYEPPPQCRDACEEAGPLKDELEAVLATGRSVMLEEEGKRLLTRYGIDCPAEGVVASEDDAADLATLLGFPVVLKILSKAMLHRGVGRGVLLNLRTADEVRDAYRTLALNAAPFVDAQILVQAMARPGLELLIGGVRDPELGMALAIGIGGSNAEETKQVMFCLPPVDGASLTALLAGWQPLADAEARGGVVDRNALVHAIGCIASMIVEAGSALDEIDVNPLIVGAPGEGVVAVDALFILRGGAAKHAH